MRGLLLLTLLSLPASGCADEPSPDDPAPTRPPAAPVTVTRDSSGFVADAPAVPAPEPFDAPSTVFDTVESPPPRSFSPPPPAPAPPPPTPPARPAPQPDATTVWGRCDVRETEGFCFSYVGAGWTSADAERHCRQVPSGAFGPAACAEAERVATCTFERPDADGQTLVYTYYAPYAVDLARLACPGAFDVTD